MLVYFASPATPIMSCATRVTPPSNQLYEACQAQASSEQDHEAECHLRGTSGRNRPTRAVCFPRTRFQRVAWCDGRRTEYGAESEQEGDNAAEARKEYKHAPVHLQVQVQNGARR